MIEVSRSCALCKGGNFRWRTLKILTFSHPREICPHPGRVPICISLRDREAWPFLAKTAQAFVAPALRKEREGRGTHYACDVTEIKGLATRFPTRLAAGLARDLA